MVSNRSLLLVLYSFQINCICISIKVLCTTPLLMAPCFLIFLPRISLSVTVIKCFCYLFCKIFPSDSIHIQVTLCPSSPPPHADAYKLRPEGSLGPLWPQATSLFEPHMLVAGWHKQKLLHSSSPLSFQSIPLPSSLNHLRALNHKQPCLFRCSDFYSAQQVELDYFLLLGFISLV